MDDIQFTDPLLEKENHNAEDMKDSHKHHKQQQQADLASLKLHMDSVGNMPLSPNDNLIWNFHSNFTSRAYFVTKTPKLKFLIPEYCSPNTDVSLSRTQTQDHMSSSKIDLGESSSHTSCFGCCGDTLSFQGSISPISFSGKASEEGVPPISSCTASSTDKDLSNEIEISDYDDDVEMDEFYTSLDVARISMLSHSREKLVTATPSDEETRKALISVRSFLSKDASILLDPESCSILKANLDYLFKLSADHGGISTEMSKVISEASQFLTQWSTEYREASMKIDSIMSQLQRADELEMSIESNKKRFLEVVALETEQLNVIKANISVSQSKAGISRKRKREIYEEGKTMKAELDELRKNVPQWEHEHTLAKKTKATIIAEWSRLQQTFRNIEKNLNL